MADRERSRSPRAEREDQRARAVEAHGRIFELYAKTCVVIQIMELGAAMMQQCREELEDVTLSSHFEGWISSLQQLQANMQGISQDATLVQRDVRIAMSRWSESVLQSEPPATVPALRRDPIHDLWHRLDTAGPRDSTGSTE